MLPNRTHRHSQSHHSNAQTQNQAFSPGSSNTTSDTVTTNGNDASNPHYYHPTPNGSAHPSYSVPRQEDQRHSLPQSWHHVVRPWEAVNPDVYRVIGDRALNNTSTSNHQRAHGHPLAQTSRDAAYNPYHYQGDPSNIGPQRRLTLDSLKEVDKRTEAASGMTRWLDEGRRNEPWDGLNK